MNKLNYAWILMLLLATCAKPEKETASGLKYKIVKAGNGDAPKKGEVMLFDFELRDSKDSVWNTSYNEDNFPAAIEARDTSFTNRMDGITQMLSALKVGDSVKTTMSVKEFFNKYIQRPVPPTVDSTLTLTYTVNVRENKTIEAFLQWRKDAVAKREDKLMTRYINDKKLNAVKDTSGMYVINYVSGPGPKPTPDNCIQVKYVGRFLQNGRIFDQNEKISFSLTQVINAWKIGFSQLAKGDSATFLVPSRLAYGTEGYYGIPPDAPLLFDVKLYDFKAGYDQATNQCK